LERIPWLPLYRVRGQGAYIGEGSPDRRVVSQRDVLANLAYKLCRPEVNVRAWLSSWSCGHVAAWCLLCRSWWHFRHGDDAPAVLCDMVSVVVFVIVSWFPEASYRSWWPPQVGYRLVVLRSAMPRSLSLRSWFPPAWRASKSRPSSWIPSRSG
jgi:hypothetical protein